MSDDYVAIVPNDPFVRPPEDLMAAAKAWMAHISSGVDEVEIITDAKPQFYDAGTNFESVLCPACEREIHMSWWAERMDEDYDGEGFRMAKYKAPCCQSPLNLNELNYEWDQAFAVCAIQGRNLNIGTLTQTHVKDVEGILGIPVTVVYAHY